MKLNLPPVYDYQADAMFGPERYAVVEGSTKVGKTYPGILWLLSEAGRVGKPGRAFWWVAPTHEQAEIAYGRTARMLRQADPSGRFHQSTDVKKRVRLNGLGDLRFKTGEEPDGLYGEDVFAAMMDEFTRQREEAWYALRSTLTATGGRCRFIGNVKGRKNWGYRMARRAENGDPDMRYRKLTADHAIKAGIMTPKELEQARRDLPESVFRELYYAEPSEDGSNPFGLPYIAACVRPLSSLPAACYGIDLARKKDYTVVVGLDENGQVCRFDRWHGLSWEATCDRIVAMVNGTPTLADSTGVGDAIVERLNNRKPNIEGFTFTQRSKQHLMEGLAVAIQNQQVFFPDGPIRKELEEFEYVPTRTGVTYSAPQGMNDDCVCALALAAKQHYAASNAPIIACGVVGEDE